jgi:ADP-ribosylglycohydrolase
VLSLAAGDQSQALAFAVQHQQLTHRSESVGAGLAVIVPAIHQIIDGKDAAQVIEAQSASLRLPKYEGLELFRKYQEYGGPAAVPAEVMWSLHNSFADEPWDIQHFTANQTENKVLKKIFSTACYVEHGVPMLLYLAYKYNFKLEEALLANVNTGGDNVHRGMVLGMLLGAASQEIPKNLIDGLKARVELEKEISTFAEIAAGGQGLG